MTHRTRMRLTLTPQHASPAPTLPAPLTLETVQIADAPALAELMFAAYQGTTDFEAGSTVQDAAEEVAHLLAGEYGEFQAQFSQVVWDGEKAVAAVLITLHESRPLLAFSMTRPDYKRRGLARLALLYSVAALAQAGATHLDLVVTDGNAPAEGLYRQLGFLPL